VPRSTGLGNTCRRLADMFEIANNAESIDREINKKANFCILYEIISIIN
jgi:hypothetical protein